MSQAKVGISAVWVSLVCLLGTSACDGGSVAEGQAKVIRSELKAEATPDNSAILGMESASDWSTTTSGAVLAQSSTHSQGSYALSVRPSNSNGYTPIKSVAMSTLATVSPTLSVDVMLPTYQPNPNWLGTAQAYIDCPSRNINSQFLNQVELTGKPLNVWNTINFSLTNSWVSSLLQAGYSDLRITVVLNVQVPTTGIYYIDNLRFSPVAANGCGGLPNGTSCTDNNACTLGDTCQTGTCHSGTSRSCNASDQCHDVGTCNPTSGLCSNPPKAEKMPCNDGDACTQTDYCVAGECKGFSPRGCTASDQCHDVGTCDHTTGECSDPPKQNDLPCDDNNACTEGDTCQGGQCQGGNLKNCPASDQCHVGVCDTVSGECGTEVAPLGTSCDDGNNCTTGDACQGGTCTGSGSGFVGPGEQCASATPVTPGPFGNFRCLLEEITGKTKNILTLRTATTAETWQLRGTLDFVFSPPQASFDRVSVSGSQTRTSAQNAISLLRDSSVASSGSADQSSGNIQVKMPMRLIQPDGTESAMVLSFTGILADRILMGQAVAASLSGTTTPSAEVDLFCREQFLDANARIDYKLGATGDLVLVDTAIGIGTPAVSAIRQAQGPNDFLVETRSTTNEILDQFALSRPLFFDRPAGPEMEDSSLAIPFSNRIQTILIRDSIGSVVESIDLTTSINTFCNASGSQQCDYRAGKAIRPVVYAANTPPRILHLPAPTSDNPNQVLPLPSSPRVVGDAITVTSNSLDLQPSVALDASGNAVVVWRRDYQDIMAEEISKDGTITHGPLKINDTICAQAWIPPGHPEDVIEYATTYTSGPRVARSPDGTFVVGWSGIIDVKVNSSGTHVQDAITCARVMNKDFSPATSPILVAPVGDVYVEFYQSYFDLAMDDSHAFVVTWDGFSENSHHYKVYAQGFSPTGTTKLTNPLSVGSVSSADSIYPTIALDQNGKAVIAWLQAEIHSISDDSNGYPGLVKMQRFNADMSKIGDVLDVGSSKHAGIPDVAVSHDGSKIFLVGRTTSNAVWSSTYDFATGKSVVDTFQANARQNGKQRYPIVAKNDNGELMVAWMDDVGTGSETSSLVSAQMFKDSGLPEDIDFTVSTENVIDVAKIPEWRDPEGFFFDAAASANDFVAVWQTSDGILLQRINGGPFSCPQSDSCKQAVPLRVTGPAQDKLNVEIFKGAFRDDDGKMQTEWPYYWSSDNEFVRAVVSSMVNGFYVNDELRTNAGKLNVFYAVSCDTTPGGYAYSDTSTSPSAPGYSVNCHDLPGFIANGLNQASGSAKGVLVSGHTNNPLKGVTNGTTFGVNIIHEFDTDHLSTFVHEYSHAAFSLSDEYDCGGLMDTAYSEATAPVLPNAYTSAQHCANRSAHPSDCRALPNCQNEGKSLYIADKNTDNAPRDVMSGYPGFQYHEDCVREPARILDQKK